MSRAFEVEGEEVLIATDGRVERSPVPAGIKPATFRHVLAAADVLYRRNGIFPTVSEILKEWDGFSRDEVSKAFVSPEMKKALAIRGIEMNPKAGLSAEQATALLVLQNPSDGRSTSAKLASIGVSMPKYRAWMRNKLFSQLMREQAENNLGDSVQMAINKLISNAESGDARAIEKILEMSGRWNPQQQDVQNARQVVLIFMEAVQKYVEKDALKLIMDEVTMKTQAVAITSGLKEVAQDG